MAPSLRQNAEPRIDQQHCEIGGRGAGWHVAGVLLVPWCIGDNELAPWGREEPVGNVDRDPLLALRLQAVDEQRKIKIVAGRAVLPGVDRESGELVLEQELG